MSALLLFSGLAAGQPIQLGPSTVQAQSLSGAQSGEIKQYIEAQIVDLDSEDPVISRRALTSLLQPLGEQGASVAFKLAYAQEIQPTLDAWISDTNAVARRRIMALRLAGDLATNRTVNLIEPRLADDETYIAMFAAVAAESAFAASNTSSPAMNTSAAEDLVEELGRLIPEESDDLLVATRVRALAQAMELRSGPLASVGTKASRELPVRVGEYLRALDPEEATAGDLRPVLDGAIKLRTLITGSGNRADKQTLVESVGLAADMISFMSRRMESGAVDSKTNSFDVQFAHVADTLGAFADEAYASSSSTPKVWPAAAEFGRLVETGNVRKFLEETADVTKDNPGNDVITIYKFKPERFAGSP